MILTISSLALENIILERIPLNFSLIIDLGLSLTKVVVQVFSFSAIIILLI